MYAQAEEPILFEVHDLWVRPGDKIALLGSNGTGKSSLLRQCWGDLQQEKRPWVGVIIRRRASPTTISHCINWPTTPLCRTRYINSRQSATRSDDRL